MSGQSLRLGAMPDLLVLAPCLPCPLDRGHRLRWYHMLKFLAWHYRIHLGCFTDPVRDRPHLGHIKALCYETCFIQRPPLGARVRTLQALARGESPALQRCSSETLAAWVARLLQRLPIEGALACSAPMAGYLSGAACMRVLDFVELESDKQRRAAASLRWPAGAWWHREAAQLFRHERALARQCEHLVFASTDQAALFGELAPESAHKAQAIGNGVDAEHFSPHIVHRNPFAPGCRALVFAGAAADRSHAASAVWFARDVFGPLHAADPALQFHVIGDRRGPRLRALAGIAGVHVSDAVADVRPYVAHAALVVAPPQHVHGQKNTVLEAMAMQKLVVASPAALAGLPARPGIELLLADGAGAFASQVQAGLSPGVAAAIGKVARARALREYNWPARLAPLAALFAGADARLADAR